MRSSAATGHPPAHGGAGLSVQGSETPEPCPLRIVGGTRCVVPRLGDTATDAARAHAHCTASVGEDGRREGDGALTSPALLGLFGLPTTTPTALHRTAPHFPRPRRLSRQLRHPSGRYWASCPSGYKWVPWQGKSPSGAVLGRPEMRVWSTV